MQASSLLKPLGSLANAPFAIGQAMLRSASATSGMVIKAVDPEREPSVTKLKNLLTRGEWLSSLDEASGPGAKARTPVPIPILLGAEAAHNLGVLPGSTIAILTSPGSNSMAGLPKIRAATVVGIFQSGYYEYDATLAYIPLDRADDLWKTGSDSTSAVYWIGLAGSDPEKAAVLAKAAAQRILSRQDVYQVMPWSDMNKSLFSALKLEKLMLTLVLSLIIFIASVTVASNLVMLSAQKTKMIGSLRSMGLSQADVGRLMLGVGGMLGALGIALGLAISGPIVLILKTTDWIKLPAEVYMLERLPVHLEFGSVLGVVFFTWAVSLLASALPAYRTARLDVSEALRYG